MHGKEACLATSRDSIAGRVRKRSAACLEVVASYLTAGIANVVAQVLTSFPALWIRVAWAHITYSNWASTIHAKIVGHHLAIGIANGLGPLCCAASLKRRSWSTRGRSVAVDNRRQWSAHTGRSCRCRRCWRGRGAGAASQIEAPLRVPFFYACCVPFCEKPCLGSGNEDSKKKNFVHVSIIATSKLLR